MNGREWQIKTGDTPGLAAQITALHSGYYARAAGFGAAFETVVATGLAGFLPRLVNRCNSIWRLEAGGAVQGSIAIDGEDLGPGLGHLRWFIVSEALRGRGAGKALIAAALAHCDRVGFDEVHLWTFAGLDAARALYARHGFLLAEEYDGDQWGRVVREQRWIRSGGGSQV
jgi:GNAT superfamily N-acetyltransferase